MKPVDGAELALWFQQQLRPQISADVARYVAEFDQFRESLDEKTSADRGAYLDLPQRLRHQWELLAPAELRPGRLVTFQVQVDSDAGPMVIGEYRVPLGQDRRLRIDGDNVEWIPSFQRGCPTPFRPGERRKEQGRSSIKGLSGFTEMLTSFAEVIEERRDGVLEALEADAFAYAGARYSSREMPIHRSTKEEVHRRAGEAAKAAVNKLAIPWESKSEDLSESERLYTWLKRGREPVWMTKLPSAQNQKLWQVLRDKGGDMYRQFATQWAERSATQATQDDFWGYMAYYLTSQEGVKSMCSKYNKPIGLNAEGVCKETSCQIHPSVNRGLLTKKTCPYQRIEIGR